MPDPTAAQLVRMKYIDAIMITRGAINRDQIQKTFSVNSPTASRDMGRYLDAGGKIDYTPQRRQYERRYHFSSLYFKTPEEAEEWLKSLYTVYGIFTI